MSIFTLKGTLWHALASMQPDQSLSCLDMQSINVGGSKQTGGCGRVERRCWVNFQCRGVLLVWMMVGQGPVAVAVCAGWPVALAVGAGGGLFGHFFSHLSFLFSFSLSLGDGPI